MSRAKITAETGFVEQQSDVSKSRFVFVYTMSIKNVSTQAFQLMSRHWVIQDANGKVEEVVGEGVVGKQPVIKPLEEYRYSSGAILQTDWGTMEGRYFMRDENGGKFAVPIPKFMLSVPRTLH